MGNNDSKNNGNDFEKFTLEEITQWQKRFTHQNPSGYIDRTDLRKMFAGLIESDTTTELADGIFRVFDANQDGRIGFKEFMLALSVQCRGSVHEKAEWIFHLFDSNTDGLVTKDEMMHIFESISKMGDDRRKGLVEPPAEYVDTIYKKLGKSDGDVLGMEDFVILEKTDPKLINIVCRLSMISR